MYFCRKRDSLLTSKLWTLAKAGRKHVFIQYFFSDELFFKPRFGLVQLRTCLERMGSNKLGGNH